MDNSDNASAKMYYNTLNCGTDWENSLSLMSKILHNTALCGTTLNKSTRKIMPIGIGWITKENAQSNSTICILDIRCNCLTNNKMIGGLI